MSSSVKPRSYDSSRRRQRALETRQRVIVAARSLFIERGYPATSMEAIAAAAEIAPATLYRLFGAKRDLLKAVIDTTSGGDDEPIPFYERPAVIALLGEPDPVRYLAGFAHLACETGQRLDPIYAVVEAAAAVDNDSADLLVLMREQRFVGQGRVARGLADRKALRKGVTVARAHDVIYGLFSPELRRVLMTQRGWTAKAYERWLADSLTANLLASRLPRDG
jgi:AcrR family transcriptional regulator